MSDPVTDAAASEVPADPPVEGAVSTDPPTGGVAGSTTTDDASTADARVDDAVDEATTVADPSTVEDLVSGLEQVTAERDEYLDALRRLQAEFENYRKAVSKREADALERANDKIVVELLPVLDACDGAVSNGADDVAPIRATILESLEKQGLERFEPADQPFDPEQHEAVMHEDSSDVDVPTVAEVLRVGYGWKGRVIRPAMVKTIG